MNEQISWDPGLVKKYSSSNHHKLLNQLRSEVKKYPLNNKKNKSTNLRNDVKHDNKSQVQISNLHNVSKSNNNINNESKNNLSSVSFNNSKNFSIYNNNNINESQNHTNERVSSSDNSSRDDSQHPTFKDRLNQIEMK